MILKTLDIPTNIIILGTNLGKEYTSGFITNELDISLLNGSKISLMCTDGGFTILTEEEFLSFIINEKFLEESDDPYEEPKIDEESGIVFF